jgi:fibronectin type 3 domain-containing protein
MRKRFIRNAAFLTLFTILSQFMFPFASAFAEESSSILPPSDVTLEMVTPDDIELTWSSVHSSTGYNIYEITDGQLVLHGETASNSYTINDLAEGSYRYVVSTLSSDGESGPSAPVSAEISYPDMAEPGEVTYDIKNGNDIVLSWEESPYTEHYNIYQLSADNEIELLTTVTSPTYTVSNAPEGQYKYAISAENSLYGESPLSPSVEAEVIHPTMTEPSNFTYKVSDGSDLTLTWDSVSFATGYHIYEMKDNEKVLRKTVTGTSYTFENVPAGDTLFEITSYSDRFGESAEGSQLTATVSDISMTAPNNLKYELQNQNDILLSWEDVPYATSYKVYQIIDGKKELTSTVTGTSVKYTYMPSGDYEYEVHSYSDRFGESSDSSKALLTVEFEPMEAPANFDYTIRNGNDIVLSWDSVSNANNYKVYQVGNEEKELISTVKGTSVTYTNRPAGEYYYEVHAISTRFGESAEGSQLQFSLVHPTMELPENLIQTIKSPTSFTLSWDTSSYTTNYRVYQVVDGEKVLKSTLSGTSVTYSNMAPGEYDYVVYAYSSRFGESAEGSPIKVTLNGETMETPTDLTSNILNGNDISLKWTGVQYANSYKVYQIIDGEKELIRTVKGTAVTFSNMPAGEHDYIVHSVSTLLGESPEGAVITVSLTHPTMEAPENLTSKVQNGNDVVLNWDSVQYANSYNIYEVIDGEKELKRTVSSLSTVLSNESEGENAYIIHSVSLRFGESNDGSEVTQEVIFPTMEKPENVTETVTNGNDITLRWDAAAFANDYNVYQLIDEELVLQRTVKGTAATFSNLPEGDYEYIVHSNSSRFGESEEGSKLSLTLVHPTMQPPENVTNSINNGNDIVLKWDKASYATEYHIYQEIDDELVLQRTVKGTAATFSNMPEGDYEYVVHSNSSRFGESKDGSVESLTLIHPTMQPPENVTKSINNGNDIVLRWDKASFATAYKVYRITEDGESVLERTVKGTSTSFVNMLEGDYEYVVHSNSDRFGDSEKGTSLTFNLTWPVVEPPNVNRTIQNVNNITLTWPVVQWANEYRVYKVTNEDKELIYEGPARTYTIYNLSENTHSFEVTAYSTRFGESKPSNHITEKIVYPIMEPPVATLKLLSDTSARIYWGFVTYANGYNIYELIDEELVLIAEKVNNLSYTINNLSYANHEYVVTSYSNSFGESDHSNVVLAKLILDEEAPVTTIDATNKWTNQEVDVTLSATDNETGVANTYYSINGSEFVEGTTFSIDEEGIHQVAFYSVDKVNNKEELQTTEVKIDKKAPVTSSDAPTEWSKETVQVQLTAKDSRSGIKITFYSINESDFKEGTSFEVAEEGVNKVAFYSVDQAGNIEATQTIEVKIDKTTPEAMWNFADEYELGTLVTLDYSARDSISGVQSEVLLVNGTQFGNGEKYNFDEPGEYTIELTVVDHAGWETTVEKTITVYIPVELTVKPEVMNENKGKFTVQISFTKEFEEGHNKKYIKDLLKQFELETATLNGVAAINETNGDQKKAEIGHFKFNREDFVWDEGETLLEFRGMVGDHLVKGKKIIESRTKKSKK